MEGQREKARAGQLVQGRREGPHADHERGARTGARRGRATDSRDTTRRPSRGRLSSRYSTRPARRLTRWVRARGDISPLRARRSTSSPAVRSRTAGAFSAPMVRVAVVERLVRPSQARPTAAPVARRFRHVPARSDRHGGGRRRGSRRDPPQSHGDASAPCRAASGARPARQAGGLARGARIDCASISCTSPPSPATSSSGSSASSTNTSSGTPRC